jgi:predicted lipid-binding transport protein (Tim44 family)
MRGNPKAETRRPKEARNPNSETGWSGRAAACFGGLLIRISGFGLLPSFSLLGFGFGLDLMAFRTTLVRSPSVRFPIATGGCRS